VTESGLEDQLLASVVRVEKPDLEQTKEELVSKQNQFLVTLAQLESDLLKNLSEADPDTILTNIVLIESLETTKATSTEIQRQQLEAKETEKNINNAREIYRRVAAEGATLYFLLIQLNVVDHMYQYSLESFQTFFFKAIDNTELNDDDDKRVLDLRSCIRITIYRWVQRGLFVRHKQIFLTQLVFRLMQLGIIEGQEYDYQKMNFLIFCPQRKDVPLPITLKKWMPELIWFQVQKIIEIELFEQLANNIELGAAKRFEDWYNELTPETEKLPLDWKKLESMPFEKLLVVRCLRPDRTTTALDNFIRKVMPDGDGFVDCDSTSNSKQILQSAYGDSTTTTPIYFILSPGVNPVEDVEYLARQLGFDVKKMLHTIALGQGQDKFANDKLDAGHKEGLWVMLQNVHLMPSYLYELEKRLNAFALEGSHPNFRLFLTSDPSNAIPIGLLEKSIKLTNEPPQGLKDNLKRSFSFFKKEEIEDKDPKIKTILFGLCYFHSVMCERRKFGTKGWNRHYPFSMGDLRDSSIVLQNYMDNNQSSGKIPWDDLKYIFGEIMYGGHIVDDWDRRFCATYLDNLMKDDLLDEAEMFPFIEGKSISFKTPLPLNHEQYIKYIEQELPPETPLGYGLHPNAEIDYRTMQCQQLFEILVDLQPKGGGSGGSAGEDTKVKDFFDLVNNALGLEGLKINIDDLNSKLDDQSRGPYQNAFIQECEKLNVLINGILRSLAELDLAYKGELTMNEAMEALEDCIRLDRVPPQWKKIAYPSERALISWTENIKARIDQMNMWKDDPVKIPKVVFINRLINPSSFLTAIKQVFCRESNPQQELNKTVIMTEVQKKWFWESDLPDLSKTQGALVFGFQVEGARWDMNSMCLDESLPKTSFSLVPVVNCRAAIVSDKIDKTVYICPVYKTVDRMNTYVFPAQLRTTKHPADKWVISGVAMILDIPGAADIFVPGKDPNA
jgi:dynein heavy chain